MISTKKRRSTRPTDPKIVAEVYVGWCPNSSGTPWRRRIRHWRWDVTFYRTSQTRPSMVGAVGSFVVRSGGGGGGGGVITDSDAWDVRVHLGADVGYALTERGAWRQVRRSIRSYPKQVG